MARTVTRHRFGRTAGFPVAAFNPQLTQRQLLTDELNRAKLQASMDALQQHDPESFVIAAEQMIKEGHPDSARLKQLVEVAKQNIEENQWQTDIKSGAKSLEDFQSYLEKRLSQVEPGSTDASKLIASISDVTKGIKARDESARDQQALLEYTKTEDNVAYANYLRDKLTRTTDPQMMAAIANQINTLSQRQTQKEATARSVQREQTIQGYMTGKTDISTAVQTLAALRDKAATPAEAKAYQADINGLFQRDIAVKRNDILTGVAQGQIGIADGITRLQALASGPADESSVNQITSAIDHLRALGASRASSAASQGLATETGNASQEYAAATKAVKDAIAAGQTPTTQMLNRVKEAAGLLSVAENKVGDYYEGKGNSASAEMWHKKAEGRDGEVTKLYQTVDDAAFKSAGVTSKDEAAFDKGLANLPPDKRVDALTQELSRLNGVSGLTTTGSQTLNNLRDSVIGKTQGAINDLAQPNEADKSVLTQAYADYKARGGKESEADFNAYLKDLNANRVNIDDFNFALGLTDQQGKPVGAGKNKSQPYTLTGTPDQPGILGTGLHATAGTDPDRVLYDALNALNAGGLRAEKAGQQLSKTAFAQDAQNLTQSQRDQYIEGYRENIRGRLEVGGQPTIPPVNIPNRPDASGLVPQDPMQAAAMLMGQQPQVDQTGDMWSQAYDSLKLAPSNFDIPSFTVPDLPDPSPIMFSDTGAFKTSLPDIRITSGETVAPPDFGGATSTGDTIDTAIAQ